MTHLMKNLTFFLLGVVTVVCLAQTTFQGSMVVGSGLSKTGDTVSSTAGTVYSGTTNVGNLATSLVISIGHTLPSASYTPMISFLGTAAVVPFFTSITTSNFTLNLSAGIAGGDNLAWSVIYSP